ncbi:transporter [Cohnella kolymensis]|uniref:Transporter n=1 Tax=Cohnella kolymensis TaxID=1590652 RepID=A0ABR5A1G5_9BACL|nr:DMT family transporter [Cohnella kolymensis]KIL34901.1 transporter [Cohnella kolymensis]
MKSLIYILLALTSLLWAGNFVGGKYVIAAADPVTGAVLRYVIACVLFLFIVLAREKKFMPPRSTWLPLFWMGVTGVALFNLLMYWALERTTADHVGLLSALNPLSIAAANGLILREKIHFAGKLGMLVSLLGVVVVLTEGHPQRLAQFQFNTGDLLMLGAVVSWGLYAVAGRQATRELSPLMSTFWSSVIGTVVMLPFAIATWRVEQPDPAFWTAVVYSAIGGTVLATLFWNIGVKQLGGTSAGLFLNLNPFFTALLAFLLLGETLKPAHWVGVAFIVAGVLLFTYTAKRRTKRGVREGEEAA